MKEFTAKFTQKEIPDTIKINRRYYQAGKELCETVKKMKINREPEHMGLFLGEDKGKNFKPSIALLDILGKMTERKAIIDDKSEWLFLCGRDVFQKSVIKCTEEKGMVIVVNKKDEVLGYGNLKKGTVMIENRLDRGEFLRKEMG